MNVLPVDIVVAVDAVAVDGVVVVRGVVDGGVAVAVVVNYVDVDAESYDLIHLF